MTPVPLSATYLEWLSAVCSLFLYWSDTIVCEVTGSRWALVYLPLIGSLLHVPITKYIKQYQTLTLILILNWPLTLYPDKYTVHEVLRHALHLCISGRDCEQWYLFSKRSLGVWQFLNLARYAKIVLKSHATCGMVSSYAKNNVKLQIPPNFAERNFCSLELIREKHENYAPRYFGAMRYLPLDTFGHATCLGF